MPGLRLHILIAGAGIGGLAAAYVLGKSGHYVTVVEAAEEMSEIGAGIQIGPNMSRLLIRWGLGPKLQALAVKPASITLCRYSSGERVGFAHFGKVMEEEFGAPYLHIHRADLLNMLYDLAKPYMKLVLGARIKQTIPSLTQPAIVLESGQIMTADLIIGADGLHSTIRQNIIHRPVREMPTGDAAYRAVIPTELMMKDPELRELVENPQYLCWMGPSRHIVGYCIRSRKLYNLVMLHPHDGTVPNIDLSHMAKLYEGWEPRIQKLLALVDPKSLTKTVLNVHEEVPNWIDSGRRIVLLGDACHTMLPYRAQGSAMAIEDAAALGKLLSRLRSHDEIASRLKMYEDIRRPRVTEIQEASWLNRRIYHLPDGEHQQLRDANMRAAMNVELATGRASNIPNLNLLGDHRKNWELFGYDIDLVVDRRLENHKERPEIMARL